VSGNASWLISYFDVLLFLKLVLDRVSLDDEKLVTILLFEIQSSAFVFYI